jgi:HEAT repeat protein
LLQDQSVETHTRSLKLLGLSESERSENALLRSRIDEQSRLIMILKQRADELMGTAKAAEKKTAHLESRKIELEEELALTMKRCSMLDARFNDLASNHQQMIEVVQCSTPKYNSKHFSCEHSVPSHTIISA